MASISLSSVGKVYADGTRAVDDLNLSIADGEFMIFVGPSGCGKTTALRMVAGLEEISEGTISIGDDVINDIDPGKRDIAMVFQNYALYPHMSVFENIAFPLRAAHVKRQEITPRVERIAHVLGLTEHLKRKPRNLSGGQRQRVAMGRAIVREPRAFLMDEPLSNLDAKLRVQMRSEISRLQAELGITTIYVTHDQVEAMTMGSCIAVMRKGVLQQQGAPDEVYNRPSNLFVATFIGSPAMNLVRASVAERDGQLICRIGTDEVYIPNEVRARRPGLDSYVGREIALGVRPEHLCVESVNTEHAIKGVLKRSEMLGPERLLHLEIAAHPVVTDDTVEAAEDAPAALPGESGEGHAVVIVRADPSVTAAPESTIAIGLDPTKLHLFDLTSGAAI